MKMGKIEKWFMNRPGHSNRASNQAEHLLQFVNPKENQKFLEVGCGNGAACKHIAQKYLLHVTGIDVDPEQIQYAQENIDATSNVQFFEGDATNLPFDDNDFDIVYSSGVMHHIGNWKKVLGEIHRVLKPKGYFIFNDLAYSGFTTRLFKRIAKNYGFYTINDITDFLTGNDFEIIHEEGPRGFVLKEYGIVLRKKR